MIYKGSFDLFCLLKLFFFGKFFKRTFKSLGCINQEKKS